MAAKKPTLGAEAKAARAWLKERHLVSGRSIGSGILAWCHAGQLAGGISISLRVTPDEAAGALCHAMGGIAQKLRVLDVRGTQPMQLEIRTPSGAVEKWEVDGLPGLIHNLNDLFKDEPAVKRLAILGEWEDMLQVWCVIPAQLPELFTQRWFRLVNNHDLTATYEGVA